MSLIQSNENWLLAKLKPLDVYLEGIPGYIAGGCFKDLFLGKEPKDIDIWFPSDYSFLSACNIYAEHGYKIILETPNAIAYNVNGTRVELIRACFGSLENILAGFTFTVTMFGYDGARCVYSPDFFKHLMFKRLYLGGQPDLCLSSTPATVMRYMLRYYGYGFTADAETQDKVFMALNGMKGEDISRHFSYGGHVE